MSFPSFKVYLDHPEAILPRRGDPLAAGYDICSVENVTIPARGQSIVDTGIVFDFPADCYARVAPRSGLAAKNRIDIHAGVIDASYRGHCKVIMFNHSDDEFQVNPGDRIAQVIFERIYTPELQQVESMDDLSSSERGANGFGSTGVASV